MITRYIYLLIALLSVSSVNAEYTINNENSRIPQGYEDIYNNFVKKITRKDETPERARLPIPVPEISFELDNALVGTFPAVLANETFSSTQALEDSYNRLVQFHNKTAAANYKMYEEMFYNGQELIKKAWGDINNSITPKEYLILTGTLSTDNGERIVKDKYIILLNPRYSDRQWIQYKIDPYMQKRVALTLTAVDGIAKEFLDSSRDLNQLASKYEDPVIKFIFSPLYSNGKNINIPFFSNN